MKENTINFDEFCKAIASIVTGANYDPRREMHFIDPKTVDQWEKKSYYWTPTSVSSTCPFCDAFTTFPLVTGAVDQSNQAMDLHGICPKCKKGVSFFAIGCERCDREENPDLKCESVWMYPIPKRQRTSVIEKELITDPEVLAFYEDAINCFNSKVWRASVTHCALALESIGKEKFTTDEKKTLKAIGEKKFETDIPKALYLPIINLTQAIRTGRTSGTHLDYTKAANEEISSKMLDLTEYALRYFYEMPLALESINALIQLSEDSA